MISSTLNPPAAGPDDQCGVPKRIGKYRIVQEVGRGGFASVYFARTDGTDQPVALKVLRKTVDPTVRDQVLARFLAEKNIAGAIPHPAIVKVIEASEPDADQPFVAMEFVEGRPFGEYCRGISARDLNACGDDMQPGLRELARLGHQIATAMTVAHGRGIVHRDLKPDNVLVTWNLSAETRATVKILDFGIAKAPLKLFSLRNGASFTRYWTDLGTVMGSPPYMAPEQDGAAHAVTGKADVYALGVMLLLSATGVDERNVEAGDFIVDLPQDLELLLLRRPNLPEEWCRTLRAMVALDPGTRPDMASVARTLQHLAQPNRAFADAVNAWLERGNVPSARHIVRFMAWAESAPPLTDEELLFLKRAPVAKLRSFRWAAILGFAVAGLACCSGLLAWFVGQQRESLKAYQSRLTETERLHEHQVQALSTARAEELEEAQRVAGRSGTQAELLRQLSLQLVNTEARLSTESLELRKAKAEVTRAESQRDEALGRKQLALHERNADRQRLETLKIDLHGTRKGALECEERAGALAQQVEAQERNLRETADRLQLCSRSLRQGAPITTEDGETSPHAQVDAP